MNLKELSEHLGLSQTTVSRALNGFPEVSESTRRRVADAALSLNYRPNARAKALATGKAWSIGHVIPLDLKSELVNPIFGEFVAGASEIYAANGYELLLSVANDENEVDIYRDLKAKGSVDGVIVQAPRRGDTRIALLHDIGMPFVVHGRVTDLDLEYSWIDINNRSAFMRATKFLLDLGHRRIGLINGQETLDFAHKRRMGFTQAMNDAGVEVNETLMTAGDLTERYGFFAASQLLECDAPPTALLVSSYITAIGVRRALKDRGLILGRDVSVIIHDDELSFFYNSEDIPLFTSTRSSVRNAGRRAAEILMQVMDNPSSGPITELMEADLSVGTSTGPCPA
jgi:LacI family transcriptional regulator